MFNYSEDEKGYLVPEIEMPNMHNLGKYGTIFINYLQENNPVKYENWIFEGKIDLIREMNLEATDRIIELVEQMFLNSESKNSIDVYEIYRTKEVMKKQAEEIIINEMIKDRL